MNIHAMRHGGISESDKRKLAEAKAQEGWAARPKERRDVPTSRLCPVDGKPCHWWQCADNGICIGE